MEYATLAYHAIYHKVVNSPLLTDFSATLESYINEHFDINLLVDALKANPEYSNFPQYLLTPFDVIEHLQGETYLALSQNPDSPHATCYQALGRGLEDFYIQHTQTDQIPDNDASYLSLLIMIHRDYMDLRAKMSMMRELVASEQAGIQKDDSSLGMLQATLQSMQAIYENYQSILSLVSESKYPRDLALTQLLQDASQQIQTEFQTLHHDVEAVQKANKLNSYLATIEGIRQSIRAGNPDLMILNELIASPECQALMQDNARFATEIQCLNREAESFMANALWAEYQNLFLQIDHLELHAFVNKDSNNHMALTGVVELSESLGFHIQDDILSFADIDQRTLAFERWLRVGRECLTQNNFMAAQQIFFSLGSNSLYRLQMTKAGLSEEAQGILESLEQLFETSNNTFPNYNALVADMTEPCIPLINTYQTRMTFAHDFRAAGQIDKANEDEYAVLDEVLNLKLRIVSHFRAGHISTAWMDNISATARSEDVLEAHYQRSKKIEITADLAPSTIIASEPFSTMILSSELDLMQSLKRVLMENNGRVSIKRNQDGILEFKKGGHTHGRSDASVAEYDAVVAARLLQLLRDNFDSYYQDDGLSTLVESNPWLKSLADTNTGIKLLRNQLCHQKRQADHQAQSHKRPDREFQNTSEAASMQLWAATILGSTDDDSVWAKAEDTKYNVTQYNYLGSDDAITGSNGVCEVRLFNADSYHGAKTEDFIDRAHALYQVALERTNRITNPNAQLKLRTWLQQTFEQTRADLIEQCPINVYGHLAEQQAQSILDAQVLIRQFMIDVITATDPTALNSKGVSKAAIRALQDEESEWTAREGRPNVIHLYQLPEAVGAAEHYHRVSAAEVMGDHTNPSTMRDRKELSNFVRVACGSMDVSTGQYRQDFFAYRHSSYPPILIEGDSKDDTFMQRRDGGAKSARQMLQTLTEAKLQGLSAAELPEGPIEISLSSMMLLSPSWLLDGGPANEDKQVEESFVALQMLNHREIDITIETDQGPTVVQVKPDFSQMNAPANSKANALLVYSKRMVNNRGFYEYQENMLSFLSKHPVQAKTPSQMANVRLGEILSETRAFLKIQLDHPSVQKAERRLQVKLAQADLTKLYEQLEGLQAKYQATDEPAEKKQLIKLYKSLDKTIRGRQKQLAKAYNEVNTARKKLRSKEQEHSIVRQQALIDSVLETPALKDWLQSDAGRPLRDQLSAQMLYLDALKIQDAKLHETYEFAHDFQARYLISNQLIGRNVDFFCKSGKDRTGRLQNYVEEFFAFRDIHGRMPSLNQHDFDALSKISTNVHEFSVCREIASHNTRGARGLLQDAGNKIGRTLLRVNRAINILTDSAMGKLAKRHLYEKGTVTPVNHFDPEKVQVMIKPMQDVKQAALDGLYRNYVDLKQRVQIGLRGDEPHARMVDQNRDALRDAYDRLHKLLRQLLEQAPDDKVQAIYQEIMHDSRDQTLMLLGEDTYAVLPKLVDAAQIAYQSYCGIKDKLITHFYQHPDEAEALAVIYQEFTESYDFLSSMLSRSHERTAEESLILNEIIDDLVRDDDNMNLNTIRQQFSAPVSDELAEAHAPAVVADLADTVEASAVAVNHDALIASILNPGFQVLLESQPHLAATLAADDQLDAKIIRFNQTAHRDDAELSAALSQLGFADDAINDVGRLVILSGERSYWDSIWQLSSRAIQNFMLDNPRAVDLTRLDASLVSELNAAKSRERVFELIDDSRLIDLSDDALRARFDSKLDTLSDSQQRMIQSAYFVNPEIKRMIKEDQRIQIPFSYAEHKETIQKINACSYQAYDPASLDALLLSIFNDASILQMNRHEEQSGEVTQASTPVERIHEANAQCQGNTQVTLLLQTMQGFNDIQSSYQVLHANTQSDKLDQLYRALTNADSADDKLTALEAYRDGVNQLSQLKLLATQIDILSDLHNEVYDAVELNHNDALIEICAIHFGVDDLNNDNLRDIALHGIAAHKQQLTQMLHASHQTDTAIAKHQKQLHHQSEHILKTLNAQAKSMVPKSPEPKRKRFRFGKSKADKTPLLSPDFEAVQAGIRHAQSALGRFQSVVHSVVVPELSSDSHFQTKQKARLAVLSQNADDKSRQYDHLLSAYEDKYDVPKMEVEETDTIYVDPLTTERGLDQMRHQRASVRLGSTENIYGALPNPDLLDRVMATASTDSSMPHSAPVAPSAPINMPASKPSLPKPASSFALLKQHFAEFDLSYQGKVISYNSRLSNMDDTQHRAEPLFNKEKQFIVEALVTLIEDREPRKRFKPVVLGGRDQTLIDESYCAVKALGYEVEFEEGARVSLSAEEIATKQSEYTQSPDLLALKQSLPQATALAASAQL